MDLSNLNLTEEQATAVEKLLQSETDKVRTKYSAELKTANEELAKYKPAEKTAEETALEERVAALEKREQELSEKERTLQVSEKLKNRGLPPQLSKYLGSLGDGDDEDKALDQLGEIFLGQSNVPNAHSKNTGITKKEFQKLSYRERAELYQTNPQLFTALAQ